MAEIGYIQVIRKCNQNCIFCSNPENDRELPLQDAQRTVADLQARGYREVILTGGEPTLYPHLTELVRHCRDSGVRPRLITNGQLLANPDFLASLADAGLEQVHVSVHSCRRETQDFLTQTPGSLQHIEQTLANCGQQGVPVSINTVINRYNADHLDETVAWVVGRFPFVRHVVWNNLDPHMNRVQDHPDVIPQFQDFEVSLFRAASFLRQAGRSFRIERVPLCYMTEFAEYSTETRKIVKSEKRDIYFLDQRGHYASERFFYHKTDVCAQCSVNRICAGVDNRGDCFSLEQIYPLFVDAQAIVRRVLGSKPPDRLPKGEAASGSARA